MKFQRKTLLVLLLAMLMLPVSVYSMDTVMFGNSAMPGVSSTSFGFVLELAHNIKGVSPGRIMLRATGIGDNMYSLHGSTYHEATLGGVSLGTEPVIMVITGTAVVLPNNLIEISLISTDLDDQAHTSKVEGLQVTYSHMVLDWNLNGIFNSYTYSFLDPMEKGSGTSVGYPLKGTVRLVE